MRRYSIKSLSIFFSIVLIPFSLMAQSKFEKKVYVSGGDTLPYNFLAPNNYHKAVAEKQSEKAINKYPLVLFLHGAGERGTDNEKQIIHIKKLFTNKQNQEKYTAFVIAPQCPEGKRWVEVDWGAKSHSLPENPSWAMKLTLELIDKLSKEYPVDTKRVYVTGLSMGGYGTWDIISRYPEKFAAAIPICGGGDEQMGKRINDIPVWAFHGGNDKVVPVSRSQNMVKAIMDAGGTPKYTEYKGVGHGSWVKAYNENLLLEWLFEKRK